MKITFVNQTKNKIDEKQIAILYKKIISLLLQKKVRAKAQLALKKEITFVFLSKKQMQSINFQYRQKNKPTDILSFSSIDSDSLGELVFCLPVLMQQAHAHQHNLNTELLYMMIHGVLHLLGYDHELSKKEEKIMFRIQDFCFEKIRSHLPQRLSLQVLVKNNKISESI